MKGKWSPVAEVASDKNAREAFERTVDEMVEDVRVNGVRGFAVVVVKANGEIGSAWFSGDAYFEVIGRLTDLQMDMHKSMDEDEGA